MNRALWVFVAASGACTQSSMGCPEGRVLDGGQCFLVGDGGGGGDASDAARDEGTEASVDAIVDDGVVIDSSVPCPMRPDPIDTAGSDTNCDGVDGIAATETFVDLAGSDAMDCLTPATACATIGRGILQAGTHARTLVLIGAGTYDESLDLSGRTVSLAGGYAGLLAATPGTPTTRDVSSTTVAGTTYALSIDQPAANQFVSGLVLVGNPATDPGSSAIAVRLRGAGTVAFQDCVIHAAAGRAGAGGAQGAVGDPGGMGGSGAASTEEGMGLGCSGPTSAMPGGPAGTASCGGTDADVNGGVGGRGAVFASSGDTTPGGAGGAVAGVNGGAGGTSDPNGATATPGSRGTNGGQGGIGASGPVPTDVHGAVSWDGFVNTGGVGSDGTPGTNGKGGTGGGGGGAMAAGLPSCHYIGGGGGGGGAAGCAGGGGTGGGPGGASIGLVLSGTNASFANVRVETEGGGAGGTGGTGGMGGPGGMGGTGGGPASATAGRAGGDGGDGGRGGDGGAGAGGSGGPSYGLVRLMSAAVTGPAPTFSVGPGGAGGTSAGNPGPTGAQSDVYAP